MNAKRVTIKDIARYLNLSTSTVSRALSNDKNIHEETKELVLKTAAKLNYRPNPIGTSLKYGISKTIGVLVPEMITPFAAEVIEGIQDVLNLHEYKVIIAQSSEDPQKEKNNLYLLENFMVDGMIICPCHYNENINEYLRLQDLGIPIVFYDRIPIGINAPSVLVDDYREAFFIVEHLIRIGRKRIVYIQGPSYIYNSLERAKGYKDALSKFRIPIDDSLIIQTGMTFDDGRRVVETLFKNENPFDAIFSFTETLALGAMNYLLEKQVAIPREVAIATFSGTIYSTIVYPQLTSVEQPLRKMGQMTAKLILEKIKNPSIPNKKIVLSSEIRLRASTKVDL